METLNITLSIPKDILLKVRLLATSGQTSVSGLLTQALETLAQQEDARAHARSLRLQRLEPGIDLGSQGLVLTQRDELHERT